MRKGVFEDVEKYGIFNHHVGAMPSKELLGGLYMIPYTNPKGKSLDLKVQMSWGDKWDHVSISRPNRCPTWFEMDFIKNLFFEPDEVVYQLHVGIENHVNIHKYCLHLWRPQNKEIPLPPIYMV